MLRIIPQNMLTLLEHFVFLPLENLLVGFAEREVLKSALCLSLGVFAGYVFACMFKEEHAGKTADGTSTSALGVRLVLSVVANWAFLSWANAPKRD